MKKFILFIAFIFIQSCATNISPVLKMAPDTYSISASAGKFRGGIMKAKELGITEANNYCKQLGQEILVTSFNQDYKRRTYNIYFHCYPKGHPNLKPQTYERTPSTVIEDRRN